MRKPGRQLLRREEEGAGVEQRRFVGQVGPHGSARALGGPRRPSGAALGAAALRWRGRWHPRARRAAHSATHTCTVPAPTCPGQGGAALLFAAAQAHMGGAPPPAQPLRAPCPFSPTRLLGLAVRRGAGRGALRRILSARPANPLLTRLLGPNLTSLPRHILTATASLRSSHLHDYPPLARLTLLVLAVPR
jgi:hypothetical protein